MANSPSARKRIRQTATRTARHVARRSRARRFVRFCEEAMAKYALEKNPSAKEMQDKGKAKKANQKAAKDSSKSDDKNPEAESISIDEHFRRAMAELHRAAQKGALHRKAVSRKVSRLAKRMKAMTQADG